MDGPGRSRPVSGEKMVKIWYLYILECRDGTLYTGITDDVQRRFLAHCQGKGAKYTRGRGPLCLRYQERCGTYSDALKREIAVKKLTRLQKLKLISLNPASADKT